MIDVRWWMRQRLKDRGFDRKQIIVEKMIELAFFKTRERQHE